MQLFKKEPSLRRLAALHAAVAFAYILSLVLFFSTVQIEHVLPDVFMAMTMLSVFVFSAAVMAMVFFFRPVAFLLEGKKKEAALFVAWTLAFFFACVASALILGSLFFA